MLGGMGEGGTTELTLKEIDSASPAQVWDDTFHGLRHAYEV